ncbi:protein NKG7-like [Emydura macquarii macquarii]|uniref:protein NKG7-like n=1 Tax=Emydura macquarii macquarii TaxID=1129001 RepID=UPI003529EDE6
MVLFRIASVVLALLSLLLLVVTLVSDNWMRGTEWMHYGLWRTCSLQICTLYPTEVSGCFHTTRFFMILAMFAGFLTSFAIVASFCCSHFRSMSLITFSALSSFSAGVSAMVAMAVFTNAVADGQNFIEETASFSWAYGLGWLSSLLCSGTGAVILLTQRSPYSPV